jgi:hypothetical protein
MWNHLRAPEGTRENVKVCADVSAAAATGAMAVGPISQGGKYLAGRLALLTPETYVLGSLTAANVQQLVTSSGDRVVTLVTRLTAAPVSNRLLYTSQNVQLCNEIKTNGTSLFQGKIPLDLFNRLRLEGLIRIEKTLMGDQIDDAYVISAEAMSILHHYFVGL